ncbi:hypothetical protein C5E45_03595 [Nocardia nova]|uniref:Uncharacterized protein n=1 Tax=Nocardia nova TaxID=37330 RepID=A0A2S6AVH4_9NOCA|nr:hypothetical protein [Nocardia nova]PPJ33481.1 hypothetical protein C5E41_02515 [Nocardia nova]PPJ39272.1 hypothetical protein C5E45_03595 [Nocardia nova]
MLGLGLRNFPTSRAHWLPRAYRCALARYRYGPGAAKVDFLVSEPIPVNVALCEPGTAHACGDQVEVYTSVNAAMRRERRSPLCVLPEPMVADKTRGLPGKRPARAYCHVPTALTNLAHRSATAVQPAECNPNDVGGDIAIGTLTLLCGTNQTRYPPG